jgi:Tol biopolymer transport system component
VLKGAAAVAVSVALLALGCVWLVKDAEAVRVSKPSGLVLYEVSTCPEEGLCTESLWTVDVATGRRRHLTPRTGGAGAAWSPDGTKIAYVSGIDLELWSMNADGSGKRRLARGAYVRSPTWSPDGRSIAFGRSDPVSGSDGEVVVAAADRSRVRTLVREAGGIYDVTWSPDGKTMAYTASTSRSGTFIVGADGNDRRRLTAGAHPTWSPDGRWICFETGAASEVRIIRPDGTGRRALTSPGLNREPAWSADSHRIAFVSKRGSDGVKVYLMRSDGGGQRRLTRDAGTGETSNWSEDDPAWSPEGDWVAYTVRSDSKRNGVHVVNADGAVHRQLVSADARQPLWRPEPKTRR